MTRPISTRTQIPQLCTSLGCLFGRYSAARMARCKSQSTQAPAATRRTYSPSKGESNEHSSSGFSLLKLPTRVCKAERHQSIGTREAIPAVERGLDNLLDTPANSFLTGTAVVQDGSRRSFSKSTGLHLSLTATTQPWGSVLRPRPDTKQKLSSADHHKTA
jgi:hypothetical protein